MLLLLIAAISVAVSAWGRPAPFHPLPDTVTDSVRLGRNIMYRMGKADAYVMFAEMEEQRGNLSGSLHNYFLAVYEYEILDDSIRIAGLKEKIGTLFQASGLLGKARTYYAEAQLIYLRNGQMEHHPDLLMRLGSVNYGNGDYADALADFQRAEAIYRLKQADADRLFAQYQQVRCFNALGNHARALEINLAILDHYRLKDDSAMTATALNNTGYAYKNVGNHEEALAHFREAAALEVAMTGSPSPLTLVNQAIVYQNMGDNTTALKKLHEASRLVDGMKDERQAAEYYHLTALVYFSMKDYHNALIYNNRTITLGKKAHDLALLEEAWLLSSRIYEAMYNYEEAMRRYQSHLLIRDSLQRQQIRTHAVLNDMELTVEQITSETERLWASGELAFLELERLKLDSANRQQELEILYKTDSIQRITIQNQMLENQRVRQSLLLREEQIYAARKAREADSIRQEEARKTLELEREQLIRKDQEKQIEILDREKEIATLQIKKVQTRNKWLAGFGMLALVIIYLVWRGLRYAKKTNRILTKQKNEIERQKDEIDYERQRSDKLLLNILPEETAEELKEKGSASPRQYDLVSVLFTDFKGFTNIAEKLTPQELVAELNTCFLAFDQIIDKHNLEKIKTIGDAYMCAGGIPAANTTNPVDVVRAGLEIKEFMERLKADRESKGQPFWELRIGIHTGPVVAGVVGKNKFAYDIWGDTVNTASRMESSGIPGKVNISGSTYALVKDRFECTHRGKITAKNKGEIDMYIVEGRKGT